MSTRQVPSAARVTVTVRGEPAPVHEYVAVNRRSFAAATRRARSARGSTAAPAAAAPEAGEPDGLGAVAGAPPDPQPAATVAARMATVAVVNRTRRARTGPLSATDRPDRGTATPSVSHAPVLSVPQS